MNERIGVGVIGVGILGTRHARVYSEQPNARLVALATSHPSKVQDMAERLGARLFSDYREMLSTLGPAGTGELEAVSVATPDFDHFDPVCAALEAGVDVFAEKPLVMSSAEARSLVALAREKSRILIVNYSQRWLPEHRQIEDSIRKGIFGEVAFVQAHRWDAAWVPEKMIPWADRSTPVHFMSSHDIDLILNWLEDRVKSVSAFSHHGALAAQKGLTGTGDGFSVLLQLQRSAVVSLHSSWILPSTFPTAADSSLEILGSKSSVFLSGSGREMRFYGEDRTERVTYGGPATAAEVQGRLEGAFTKSLQAFLDAVEKRDLDTPTSAARTIHVVEVQEAIMKAAASGEIVRL